MHSPLPETLNETLEPRLLDAAATARLPPDLLREASKRLGWAALLYSVAFFLAFFGSNYVSVQTGALVGPGPHPVQVTVAVVSILLGLAVFATARFTGLRPDLLLDLGLVFEVVGALGIATSEFWGIFPEWPGDISSVYLGISWVCLWIVVFPLLAPNTLGKTLLASLAAASMPLLAVVLSKSGGATSPEAPLAFFLVYFAFTTYLSAGMAVVVSRWVYHYGIRLTRAREVGSYRLVERLGVGGMGEVWRADHRLLLRDAAVKIVRPELLAADPEARRKIARRFEREAQATAALESINTIQLFDFGITREGAFFYVMELLDGLSLETLVKRFGPVSAGRAVYILRQACRSLEEAHGRGMIHRDVKPSNIFTCRLGPDHDFVKVLDFGLVKTPEGFRGTAAELTAEGLTTGTPAYMSPEMALGGEIDPRTDIYALGCVAYWLLSGQQVFEGDSSVSVIVEHVHTKPIPPSRRTEIPVPPDIEEVVLACLEKDPSRRPPGAAELERLLADCETDPWGPFEAREWWTLHLPESEFRPALPREDGGREPPSPGSRMEEGGLPAREAPERTGVG